MLSNVGKKSHREEAQCYRRREETRKGISFPALLVHIQPVYIAREKVFTASLLGTKKDNAPFVPVLNSQFPS